MTQSLRVSCAIVVWLACLVAPAASAQHMHMSPATSGPSLGASAAFDARGHLWVASAHDGHVLLRESDDFGKTFGAPIAVNAVPEKIAATRENHPDVAIGTQGQVYVSWSHPLTKKYASQIRFARSLDGGKTFATPITVNRGPTGVTHSFNAMTIAGNGDVVIAWLDGREMAAGMAAGKSHHGLSLYYSWSADAGKRFVPARRLMDHTCECCRIALASEPDGRVAAFFRGIFGDNIRDHAFGVLRTDDAADDWQRATWSGWQIAACPEQGPGLAIGPHGVRHAVWYEASHGPAIWYAQLDLGHRPRHKLRIGGPGASHADVAVHDEDVWVVWNQVSADGYTLMLRSSRDGGDHFGAPRAIAESSVGVYSPQLLVHDGRAYVGWNTAAGFRLVEVSGR